MICLYSVKILVLVSEILDLYFLVIRSIRKCAVLDRASVCHLKHGLLYRFETYHCDFFP